MTKAMDEQAVKEMYRQGDLLFVRQPSLPQAPSMIPTPRKTGVILEGETTGHAHRLTVGAVLDMPNGEMWIRALEPTEVVHEEHHTIELSMGVWQVIRQREYQPKSFQSNSTYSAFRFVED